MPLLDIIIAIPLFLKTVLSSIGPFILLLGLLIFIHELGHFLVARWCGVTVEVFSLGFGPKIFKYKRGETLYCISLLPLGGYVKMYGDSLIETPPKSEQHRGFLYQNVPRKLAIAFGGPLMNLLFAFCVFYLLALMGLPALLPETGDIKKNTKAWETGFRPGDKILSISNQPISFWADVDRLIKKSPEQTLEFKVESKGMEKTLSVPVATKNNSNIFEFRKEVGHIEGLTPLSAGTGVGVISPETPAYKAGLRTFDQITHINDREIKYWRDLESTLIQEQFPIHMKVKRTNLKGKEKNLSIVLSNKSTKDKTLKDFGLEEVELYLYKVGPKTPAEKAGLKPGDRLIAINGTLLKEWEDVLKSVQSNTDLTLSYQRDGQKQEAFISPEEMFVEGNLKERRMIGIGSAANLTIAFPAESVKNFSVFSAAKYAGFQTVHGLKSMALGLFHIIKGTVSPRNLSGPVAIGRIAYKFFHTGFYQFLSMMALISLSLFFFNILPIPLLDGGHILFFTLEGIMGRPLDVKKLLAAQQAGLVL
ncbi:MAG: RIP metalloprotease RseP, partial [Bdellovibrionales bacterium]|nr:RIP metalloprotease RseP [Bdellovibrionales bacterium]